MVNIFINYDCNKSCNFCFQKGVKFDSMMSFEDFKKVINWLEQLKFFQNPEKRRVSLIGGEPTLHPKLKDMIQLLKEKNITATVFSNFVFNKKKIELFDQSVVKGFVGTYNPKSWYKKSEYDLMENNISKLKKRGFDVKLSYNIVKGNLDYKYVLDACERHELKNLRFSTGFPNPDYNNNYMNFEDLKKAGKQIMSFVREAVSRGITLDLDCTVSLCILGDEKDILFFLKHVNATNLICKSAIDINPDLSMYYCLPRAKDVNVKNILEFNNLREINEIFDKKNNRERNKVYTFPECKTCKYHRRSLCQGGCLAVKKKFSFTTTKELMSKGHKKKLISIKTWGGIGDGLLVTPSLKALKQKYPNSEIRVVCNDNHKEIFENNPNIDVLSTQDNVFKNLKLDKFHETNYGRLKPSINYKKHATEIIADILEVELKNNKLEIFLTEKEEEQAKQTLSKYNNPITIHITSKCSKNQEWPVERWEEVVKRMPNYTFIQLGLKNEPRVEGAVDMMGKTTVREAIALVKHSKAFVGVISAFAHATNAVNTPTVVLFGPSTPVVWGYENNVNIYKDLKCAPCIDTLGGKRCPYDKKCMKKISVREVEQAIKKITNKNTRNVKTKLGLLKKIIIR